MCVKVLPDGAKWGVYCSEDEAEVVDEDDLNDLSMEELQQSYEVECSPMTDIEKWISKSVQMIDAVENQALRRSARTSRTRIL